ncbi:MAG: S8 family peptidase [Solirubrobacterales bacterium]
MRRGTGTNPWVRAVVLAIFACLLLPAGALAAVLPLKPQGPLSPLLARLAKPRVQALAPARQAQVLGVAAAGPGSLLRRGDRVLTYVRFDGGAVAALPALRGAGARVVGASSRYQTVTAAIPAADLHAVAEVPGVEAVFPVRTPALHVNCNGGSVISEGVEQLNVKKAREKFPVNGEGLTVGVLSDSFDQATEAVTGGKLAATKQKDEETADLTGPKNTCTGQKEEVNVLRPFEPESLGEEAEAFDEGRAMLQVVHDIAPQAKLAFNSAFNGELAFAEGIENLAKSTLLGGAGAKVIVDDVGYFEEPFFQDGPVAAAINKVTAAGVTYLTAGGNDNLFDSEGNEIASWEAPAFHDSGECPGAVRALSSSLNPHHCLDFNPGAPTDRTFGIKVEPHEVLSVDLQWAEPWFGVETDLDAYLLNSEGQLVASSTERNGKTHEPVEIIQWANNSASERTVQLVVNRFSGSADPRLKFILLQDGGGVTGTEYPKSGGGDVVGPAIYGHAGAASAISVGAVPFNDSSEPEFYSSRGPVTHYFGPVKGKTPAAELGAPEELSKPDVAATDCARTTFFAEEFKSEPGIWRFCGTSEAAPHAAGVTALMLQEEPGASPAEVREALAESAKPVGTFDSCAVGGGLLDALGALEAIVAGPPFTPAKACEPPESPPGEVFVVPGNWGSEEPVTPPVAQTPTPTPQPLPPVTRLVKHPPKVVRTRSRTARVIFRFGADQAGARFLCKVDGGGFRSCPSRFVHRFGLGPHVVRVKAVGSTGLADSTPAVFRFRVEHVS